MSDMTDKFTGFPSLKPAVITKVNIGDINDLGKIFNGSQLTHFGIPTGTIETVAGFEPAFKANVVFGADWLSFDPDSNFARVDLKGIAKTEKGYAIDFRAAGVIRMIPEIKKIAAMDPTMATIPFGAITATHTFLTADPELKMLESSVFCSNSRFIVSETGLSVETRQALVVASTDMD
ncbi:hypothetical protein CKAH01_13978 [Colletotrichum kahawae]|uniref:Uncharacterized protein n=1 Tax=Colletotrichum kahawae TaxID=34407 RepID=A0AAD9YP25_COLKA|nr:hypothetical protein CKAH01_13978 [Colletotrichum kahawae]